ncbi:hypothetical protein DFQ26_003948 [Actinomortierella ambigua]|nr:hypothetical protein DFQ26_003948 [Actinomortierella ambigua]
MYSILCVQRGQLIESVRQYDSDEEDLSASRRLLWPDRGDGRSFETLEDYEDDEEYNPMTLEQIREDIEQRVRAAQLAPRPVLSHMERKPRQQKSSDVVYIEDFFQEEAVEARGEALLCKTAPEDSALDLGYSADDEDLHRSGTATPQRRTPKRSKGPPEINRGYTAESSVVVYRPSPGEEPQRSASPCNAPLPISCPDLPSTGPSAHSKSGRFSPAVLFVIDDGDDNSNDDSDGAGHQDKVYRSLRRPMSDTTLFARHQDSLFQRGTQSCRLGEDPSNPFRPTPSATEDVQSDFTETSCRRVCDPAQIPVRDDRANSHLPSPTFRRSSVDRSFLEKTPSNNEDEDEEDWEDLTQDPMWKRSSPEPELDFGASILAARPLVLAPPPPPPFLRASLCKHSQEDGDDEEPLRDAKRSRHEYESDFGATILASRPLVLPPPPLILAPPPPENLVMDFGASILASRPLVMAPPPPENLVMDFGASILASRPLVMAPPPRPCASRPGPSASRLGPS